jgi:hypothetical protein
MKRISTRTFLSHVLYPHLIINSHVVTGFRELIMTSLTYMYACMYIKHVTVGLCYKAVGCVLQEDCACL